MNRNKFSQIALVYSSFLLAAISLQGQDVASGGQAATARTRTALADGQLSGDPNELADLPVGLTSFGAAVAGNKIYVYGGHTGGAHTYSESGQNKTLYELDLAKPSQWKKRSEGLGLQGLAMVAHKDRLYRLGGFHAHNKQGEKHDLRSVNEFAVFDFNTGKWNQLTPMPVSRSSFDAVVVDHIIYVVGGWTLKGQKGTTWCKSAICFDLEEENGKWKTLPTPPFQRRALSLGFQGNHLVAIGGMQQKGGITRKVAIYDLESSKWQDGPELPSAGRMEGFGSSCFNVGGQLVVSTYGGNVYRLSEDRTKWESVSKLDDGRFFHRLLPISENEFVLVGGASMESGKFYSLEVLKRK